MRSDLNQKPCWVLCLAALMYTLIILAVRDNRYHGRQQLLLFPGVEADIMCEFKPCTGRHIADGQGACYRWTIPDRTELECCFFCDQMEALVSRLLPAGRRNPFNGAQYRTAACCCYNSGVFVNGGDGTRYYAE